MELAAGVGKMEHLNMTDLIQGTGQWQNMQTCIRAAIKLLMDRASEQESRFQRLNQLVTVMRRQLNSKADTCVLEQLTQRATETERTLLAVRAETDAAEAQRRTELDGLRAMLDGMVRQEDLQRELATRVTIQQLDEVKAKVGRLATATGSNDARNAKLTHDRIAATEADVSGLRDHLAGCQAGVTAARAAWEGLDVPGRLGGLQEEVRVLSAGLGHKADRADLLQQLQSKADTTAVLKALHQKANKVEVLRDNAAAQAEAAAEHQRLSEAIQAAHQRVSELDRRLQQHAAADDFGNKAKILTGRLDELEDAQDEVKNAAGQGRAAAAHVAQQMRKLERARRELETGLTALSRGLGEQRGVVAKVAQQTECAAAVAQQAKDACEAAVAVMGQKGAGAQRHTDSCVHVDEEVIARLDQHAAQLDHLEIRCSRLARDQRVLAEVIRGAMEPPGEMHEPLGGLPSGGVHEPSGPSPERDRAPGGGGMRAAALGENEPGVESDDIKQPTPATSTFMTREPSPALGPARAATHTNGHNPDQRARAPLTSLRPEQHTGPAVTPSCRPAEGRAESWAWGPSSAMPGASTPQVSAAQHPAACSLPSAAQDHAARRIALLRQTKEALRVEMMKLTVPSGVRD